MVSRADTRTTSNCVLYGSEKKACRWAIKKLSLSLILIWEKSVSYFSLSPAPGGIFHQVLKTKGGDVLPTLGAKKIRPSVSGFPFFLD